MQICNFCHSFEDNWLALAWALWYSIAFLNVWFNVRPFILSFVTKFGVLSFPWRFRVLYFPCRLMILSFAWRSLIDSCPLVNLGGGGGIYTLGFTWSNLVSEDFIVGGWFANLNGLSHLFLIASLCRKVFAFILISLTFCPFLFYSSYTVL